DRAGGAVFARDPLRVEQRERSGFHRELHGCVEQAPGGVSGVDVEFDGLLLGLRKSRGEEKKRYAKFHESHSSFSYWRPAPIVRTNISSRVESARSSVILPSATMRPSLMIA